MFYDNFKAACKRKGTNMTVVLSELGYSTSSTGSWKAGSFPRLDIAINIANHLEISLDELVYGINNAPSELGKMSKSLIKNGLTSYLTFRQNASKYAKIFYAHI